MTATVESDKLYDSEALLALEEAKQTAEQAERDAKEAKEEERRAKRLKLEADMAAKTAAAEKRRAERDAAREAKEDADKKRRTAVEAARAVAREVKRKEEEVRAALGKCAACKKRHAGERAKGNCTTCEACMVFRVCGCDGSNSAVARDNNGRCQPAVDPSARRATRAARVAQ